MDEQELRGMRLVLAAVLAAIVVGGTVDLLLDAPDRWLSLHVMYEVLLIAESKAPKNRICMMSGIFVSTYSGSSFW